ncbi:MAG: ParA family protein [Bacteriovoracia bacterium]
MSGYILSVANQKGGVGKSTSTINLAQAFALNRLNTLVVDLDPQANTTVGLGVDTTQLSCSVADVLRNRDFAVGDAIKSVGHVDLLPAKKNDLINIEREMLRLTNSELRLRQKLSALREHYSVILIDTPPTFGPLMNSSLNTADFVVVPVDCGTFSLLGIKDLLAEIDLIKEGVNPDLSVLGYFLTMFDRTNLAHETKRILEQDFGADKVFSTQIGRSVKLKEAAAYGETIFHFAPSSTAATEYLRMSIEIIQKLSILPGIDPELMEFAFPQKHAQPAQVVGGAQ